MSSFGDKNMKRGIIGNGILVTKVGDLEVFDNGEVLMDGWNITLRGDCVFHSGRQLLGYDLSLWGCEYAFYDSGRDITRISVYRSLFTIATSITLDANGVDFHSEPDRSSMQLAYSGAWYTV